MDADLFDSWFRLADRDRDGRISGSEAVDFFQRANLPQDTLFKASPERIAAVSVSTKSFQAVGYRLGKLWPVSASVLLVPLCPLQRDIERPGQANL